MRTVQSTSVEAYEKIDNLGDRQHAVYLIIEASGPVCNQVISAKLNVPINQITPRTRELAEMNLVEEKYKDIGPSGRKVIFWGIKDAPETVVNGLPAY